MAHQLADELLKEILWPPLVVPDQLFADTGAVSPFSKALYSAADVLLVCKRWMRVATPSLYHTVIIRSTAQAQALAAALTRNPEFGRYIKKLRIEGAYGVHLSKIAPVAPNIVHFCFSLSIWADSSPGGLLKLLSAIQPSRVILTTSPGNLKNKKLQGVVDKLCTCIPLWTKLEGFQFTGSQTWHSVEFDQYPAIAHSLALSSSLQWVHIFPNLLSISAATLSALADSNTIRTFYVQSASISGPAERLWWMLPARMRSRAVVIHHGTTYSRGHSRSARAKQPAFVNPFYVPMSTAPHALRTKIWTLIFDFALEGKTSTKRAPYRVWYDVERYHAATARSLMLLSRSTLATVVPLLCRHVAVDSEVSFATLLRYMDRYGIPGSTVQSVKVLHTDGPDVAPLLQRTTHLRVCTTTSDPKVLRPLGRTAGSTLEELSITGYLSLGPLAASLFYPFTRIVTLRMSSSVPLKEAREEAVSAPPTALSELSIVQSSERCTVLFDVLTRFTLPNLSQVRCLFSSALTARFLQQHGSKLKILAVPDAGPIDLHLCSALEELELTSWRVESQGGPGAEAALAVPFPDGHPCLRCFKLHWQTSARSHLTQSVPWELLLKNATRTKFPALRSIVLAYSIDIWPTNERDMKKNPWPKYAEDLATKGITLLDHTGRAWRPRLPAR